MEHKREASPQEDREARLDKIRTLTTHYGSIRQIPEDKLKEIDYLRFTNDDGTIEIIPKERLEERTKIQQPFGEIKLDLETKNNAPRFIPKNQIPKLEQKLYKMNRAIDVSYYLEEDEIFSTPKLANIRTFLIEIDNFYKNNPNAPIETDDIPFYLSLMIPTRTHDSRADFFRVDENITEHNYVDADTGNIPSKNTESLFNHLSRMSGYFADKSELIKDLNSKLGSDPGIGTDLDKNIHSNMNLLKKLLPPFLEAVNLSQSANVLNTSKSPKDVLEALSDVDINNPHETQIRKLKQKIKEAPIEEKRLYSRDLKDLELSNKKRLQIKLGLIDFFNSPQIVSESVAGSIQDVQNFLTTKSIAEQSSIIYLDGRPNKELDRDPGVISGDCTEGNPLPFDGKSIFNIKVLDEQKNHIGNMYLLETKADEPKSEVKKVWHLDAIQIPNPRINWEQGVKKIIETLAIQADQADIDAITVNDEDHLISNYDYISREVLKLPNETMRISMPIYFLDSYSNPQGTGTALALWQRSRTQSETTRKV